MKQDSLTNITEAVVNAMAEPVLILDHAFRVVVGNIAFCNAMQLESGRLEGKTFEDLIQGLDNAFSFTTMIENSKRNGRTSNTSEVTCDFPSGERKILAISVRHLYVEESEAALVLVELRDITRERATEESIEKLNVSLQRHITELEARNEELASFAYSASHDLRAPLRFANRIASMLLQDHAEELGEQATSKVNMILDSTQQMGKLTEDLLAFAEISRAPMKHRRVNMRRLAEISIAELTLDSDKPKYDITIGEIPSCEGDRSLLKQVFINLLSNAMKFSRMREAPAIHLGCDQLGGEQIYFVHDNGVGFDMSQSEGMFIAFHRLHRSGGYEGSGVGLALVRRIVERHGGRCWSEGAPGRGSTIYFTLGEQSQKSTHVTTRTASA